MLALLVFGCVGKAPETQAPTAPIPEVTAPTAVPGLPGRYEGHACGARTYDRVLELRADGTYTLQDLIAPCPPDVACVWSGIAMFEGTWAESGADVTVTEAPAGAGPAQPRAAAYTRTAGGLVDGAGCGYAKVGG